MRSFIDHDITEDINPCSLDAISNNTLRDLRGDDHIDNVFHGYLSQCLNFPTNRTRISLIVLRDCKDSHDLKTRIEKLGKINEFKSVVKILSPVDLTHLNNAAMFPCLVTERIPSLTFQEWINKGQRLSRVITFFKKLFSAISSFHQEDEFFGKLLEGSRVRGNKPMLVLPARSNGAGAVDLDTGRIHDLKYLRDLVLVAFPRSADRDLFVKLCNLYAHENAPTATGNHLRNASYVILHCPLVWERLDRFHFIMRLHLYRSRDPDAHDMYVRDSSAYGRAVPLQWQRKLDHPTTTSARI